MSQQKSHSSNIHLLSENSLVHDIVETNISYYSQKWQKHSNPSTYSGWNWAAFFFPPAWLSYRHMYSWTFVFFSLYLLGIISLAFLPFLIHSGFLPEYTISFWTIFYPIIVNVYFGFKGNAFYTKRVISLAQWKKGLRTKPIAPLFNKTGCSWTSALFVPAVVSIILFVPYQTIDMWTYNPSLPYGVYVFSDDAPTPEGILDVKKSPTFVKYDARINFLYYGDEPIRNRFFEVNLFYNDEKNSDEWILERKREYSIFSSNRVSLDLIDAEDPAAKTGQYRLEIYLDGHLQAKEIFEIVLPNQF